MRVLGPALLTPLVGPLLLLAGCGGDFASVEPDNPSRVASGLVFTRADGSSYELEDAVARCLEDRARPGVQVVQLTAPADAATPILRVEVVPGVQGEVPLPLDRRDPGVGLSDVTLVGLDPARRNVLSGSVKRSAGELTVVEATCDPEPRLAFTVDAVLATSARSSVQVDGGLASVSGH